MEQSGNRLNKFLAVHLGIGRRQADNLIAAGQVRVNGSTPILGARISGTDRVEVNGKQLSADDAPQYIYLLMNKPVNYVCSRRQQGDTPTVYSLLPNQYQSLKTVGRLDKDTSGLILLTNDGDLAHKLTHPSFGKIKKYEVTLDKPLAPLHHQMINDHGVQLPDGPSKLTLERQNDGDSHAWIITMHEGRNRQIRRTFAALGYNVTKLHRTQFGDLQLQDLKSGQTKLVNL